MEGLPPLLSSAAETATATTAAIASTEATSAEASTIAAETIVTILRLSIVGTTVELLVLIAVVVEARVVA